MGHIAVSFTGGKDSVLALHLVTLNVSLTASNGGEALQALEAVAAAAAAAAAAAGGSSCTTAAAAAAPCPISLLVTFAPQGHDKPGQGFKAHPIPVIRAQAKALGIPHIVCELDSTQKPLEGYRQHIKMLHQHYGITQLVTGDILDVAGGFMQKAAEGTGVSLVTPLWQLPRELVLQALLALRIDSIISCISVAKYTKLCTTWSCLRSMLDAVRRKQAAVAAAGELEAAGAWDDPVAKLLGGCVTKELVAGPLTEAQELFGADLGGELGEYHTLVMNAPLFAQAVKLSVLRVKQAGDYAYLVLDVPAAS
jgi:diphthamide synthase (EF-2-diphthine--ammonia ligase)